jgi:uncharacterized protein (DUF488 family)
MLTRQMSSPSARQNEKGLTIFTVGHSTRPAEEFVALLQGFGIELLADVRTVPRSRRNPQFEKDALREILSTHGIEYIHLPSLGGLRHPRRDSVNTGWQNASFRGYADYMQTGEFARAVQALTDLAATKRIAIMCAEAVPWRCHRSLLGDALLARGIEVIDILNRSNAQPHKLTAWAHVEAHKLPIRRVLDCAKI